MKKIAKFSFAALTVLAAVSCSKEFGSVEPEYQQQIPTGCKAVTFNVTLDEITTKAATLGSDLKVSWEVGDSVAVIDTATAAFYGFRVVSAQGSSAVISGVVADTTNAIYAVYPMKAALAYSNKVLKVSIPEEQLIPAGKNIDGDALVSLAKANVGETLSFSNLVSLVKFSVSAAGCTVVNFTGNNSEVFTGSCKESKEGFTAAEGKLTVKVDCGFSASTNYYAAVCPVTFSSGFSAGVLGSDGSVTVKKGTNTAAFVRNGGLEIGDVCAGGSKALNTITNKAELAQWAEVAASYPQGANVKLTADIDWDGEWTAVRYYGNFDGGNHSVYGSTKGLTFKSDADGRTGFFAEVSGEIKNLKLGYDPAKTGYDGLSNLTCATAVLGDVYIGAFAACASSGNVLLENLENYVPLTVATTVRQNTSFNLGGIIGGTMSGADVRIASCKNYGAIDMNFQQVLENSQYVGGILGFVGSNNCTVESCLNKGAIEGSRKSKVVGNIFAAGIVGRIGVYNYGLVIKDCNNEGNVNMTTNLGSSHVPYVAGIIGADNDVVAGEATLKVHVSKCTNKAKISCKNQTAGCGIGGIAAFLKANSLVEGCTNTSEGLIEKSGNMADNPYLGGIVGRSSGGTVGCLVSNCVNYGKVYELAQSSNATLCYGGIVGGDYIAIKDCINYGTVEAVGTANSAYVVGGIAGLHGNNTPITGCQSYGDLKSAKENHPNSCCGGIVGRQNNVETHTFENCIVNCTITTKSNGGMLIGGYKGEETPVVEFGTEESPVKVAGTINGTKLTAENYTNYLSGKTVGQGIFHTVFLAE